MSTLEKSLADLIDETLAEIEVLKKSERFSAHEVELGDKKANGSIESASVHKAEEKEEDEEEKEEGEEKAEKAEDEDEDEDMSKAEEEVQKAEAAAEKAMKKYEMCKAEAEHKKKMLSMKKGESEKKEEEKKEEKEEGKELKKSIEARVAPLEAKIADVLAAVKTLANSPVPARGYSYKNIQPLAKSDEGEPLSKAVVLDKLFELKKSGKSVLTEDIIGIETGSNDFRNIATKYGIK